MSNVPSSSRPDPLDPARRSWLARATAAIAAAIGAVLAIPLAAYVASPALRRTPRDWVEVGAVDALAPLAPTELTYAVTARDGWMPASVLRSVWAIKQPDGGVTAFAPICTHLGCAYRFAPGSNQFHCPCHNSLFALDGTVLGGPAPRPLDRLPAKVENGKLFVIYKEFKAGVPDQIET